MKKWLKETLVGSVAALVGGLAIWGIRATSKGSAGGAAPHSGPPGRTGPTGPAGPGDSPGGSTGPAGSGPTGPGGPLPPAAIKTWIPVQVLVAGDRARASVSGGAMLPFLQSQLFMNWFLNNKSYFNFASGGGHKGAGSSPILTWSPTQTLPADWPSSDQNLTGGYHVEYTVTATTVPANFPPLGAWRAWKLT